MFGLSAAALLLAGCATSEKQAPLAAQGEVARVLETEGLELSLTFLDETVARSRFGRPEGNPFLPVRGVLSFRRIVPFELRLTNRTENPVTLQLNRLELQFGAKSVGPTNSFQLTEYWGNRDDIDSLQSADRNRKKRIIQEEVLRDKLTLAAGASAGGIVAFMGDLPRYGAATIYVPVLDPTGQLIHRFQTDYEF